MVAAAFMPYIGVLAGFMEFIQDIGDRLYTTFIHRDNYLLFLKGFSNTIIIAVCATVLGTLIGVLVAVGRVYHLQTGKLKPLNVFLSAYLAFFRGTPVLVQLMIFYYIIFTGIKSALFIAVLGFSINSGAYVAEVVRSGIMSIDIGQTEAGRSLGLSASATMRKIILPQALKNILPALFNEFIVLLKETSVAGFITVVDLTRAGDLIRAQTLDPFVSLFFVAAVYLVMVIGLTAVLKRLERRLRKSDRR